MRKRFVVIALIIGSFVCTGHLLSYARDPVSGVLITVVKGDKVYPATTGEDGRFTLSKLPSGKYVVSAVIIPNTIDIYLSGNSKEHIAVLSPVPGTGGVNTHIELTRNGKKLSGKVSEEVLPEPSPMPSPEPTPG